MILVQKRVFISKKTYWIYYQLQVKTFHPTNKVVWKISLSQKLKKVIQNKSNNCLKTLRKKSKYQLVVLMLNKVKATVELPMKIRKWMKVEGPMKMFKWMKTAVKRTILLLRQVIISVSKVLKTHKIKSMRSSNIFMITLIPAIQVLIYLKMIAATACSWKKLQLKEWHNLAKSTTNGISSGVILL